MRFHQYTEKIHAIWEWHFNKTIGNWQSIGWWLGFPAILGFMLTLPLVAISSGSEGSTLSPMPYLRSIYCPQVNDCIVYLHYWPLPAWYSIYLALAFLSILAGMTTQWAYRRKRWCLAWWAYMAYLFSFLYFFGALAEFGLFVGLSGAPIPIALVGYGLPIVYTVWFMGTLLPTMRLLWQGKYVDFRPPPLKLQAGAGSAAVLLGVLGVALGRMLGEMPNGHWGYFIVGVVGVPCLMYLGIRSGVESLLTLAPWRIVLEAETKSKKNEHRKEKRE